MEAEVFGNQDVDFVGRGSVCVAWTCSLFGDAISRVLLFVLLQMIDMVCFQRVKAGQDAAKIT